MGVRRLGARRAGAEARDRAALLGVLPATLGTGPLAAPVRAVGADLIHQPDLAADYRRRFVDPLRDAAIALVVAGRRDGTFATDADSALVVDAVIGPLIYRGLIDEPMPSRDALLALGLGILRSGEGRDGGAAEG